MGRYAGLGICVRWPPGCGCGCGLCIVGLEGRREKSSSCSTGGQRTATASSFQYGGTICRRAADLALFWSLGGNPRRISRPPPLPPTAAQYRSTLSHRCLLICCDSTHAADLLLLTFCRARRPSCAVCDLIIGNCFEPCRSAGPASSRATTSPKQPAQDQPRS